MRWMGFHLDNVSGFFILATVAIAFALKGNAPAAEVALGLTSAMGLAGPVQMLIRSTADVANQMTSVQRMQSYAQLPAEGPSERPGDNSLRRAKWPQEGGLVFSNVTLRYRPAFPPVAI